MPDGFRVDPAALHAAAVGADAAAGELRPAPPAVSRARECVDGSPRAGGFRTPAKLDVAADVWQVQLQLVVEAMHDMADKLRQTAATYARSEHTNHDLFAPGAAPPPDAYPHGFGGRFR